MATNTGSRLLLISSSSTHGSGYLDHCADELRHTLRGIRRVLFVPYALHDRDAYARHARLRFTRLDLELDSLHLQPDPLAAVNRAEGFFVGGGNTFRLLDHLQRHGLIDPIRSRVAAGAPYTGASAGSNLACPSIRTTNDMPIVQPISFDALGLVPFNINPHYVDPDPDSTHRGETRETRIREFHEMNDPPIVGLREGAMLRVEGGTVELRGTAGARLFVRGREPVEAKPGERLDWLLSSSPGVRESGPRQEQGQR